MAPDSGSNGRATPDALDGLVVRVGRWTTHLWTPDEALHWAIDREGRLVAGHVGGAPPAPAQHLRVGLDAAVVARGPGRGAVARRLPSHEGDELLAGAARDLRAARARLLTGAATLQLDLLDGEPLVAAAPSAHPADQAAGLAGDGDGRADDGRVEAERARVLSLLERAAARAERPDLEREAFARVYRPVRVLPPDCAQALVVQLTEGCSYGQCTFCSLYKEVRFRIKPWAAFTEHLDGVAALLGEGAALRSRVFLGDANALLSPMASVLEALEAVRRRFPAAARDGVHTFVDAFSGRGRTEEELRALRGAGLGRVTVGLESGHLPLLAWLRKPATPDAVAALVRRARRAGLEVGVTVLVGAGGRDYAGAHVRDTVRAVRELGLGARDLVFLSPLVIDEQGEYARRAARSGVAALRPDEVHAQAVNLAGALSGGPWRVTNYDLRRWVY